MSDPSSRAENSQQAELDREIRSRLRQAAEAHANTASCERAVMMAIRRNGCDETRPRDVIERRATRVRFALGVAAVAIMLAAVAVMPIGRRPMLPTNVATSKQERATVGSDDHAPVDPGFDAAHLAEMEQRIEQLERERRELELQLQRYEEDLEAQRLNELRSLARAEQMRVAAKLFALSQNPGGLLSDAAVARLRRSGDLLVTGLTAPSSDSASAFDRESGRAD